MTGPDDEPTLSVGELARRTGLTVRALHHYDELGLLPPSARTGARHRRYGEADVARLLQIVALRRLGLSLEQVRAALGGGHGLVDAVRAQLDAVRERLAAEQRLQGVLESVLAALEREQRPGVDLMLTAIERTTMLEKHYTQDQLEALAQRREAYGEDQMRAFERDWQEILDAARAAMEAGTDPGDPSLAAHARRSAELLEAFTGGDAGIRGSLDRTWREEDPEVVSRGAVDRELFAYLGRMREAHAGG